MNILVIGATGWIGGATCDALLARGHAVWGLVRPESAFRLVADKPQVSPLEGTLEMFPEMAASLSGIDGVVFAASGDPEATAQALDAVKYIYGVQAAVYISGASIYGNTGIGQPATEESELLTPASVSYLPMLEEKALTAAPRGYALRGAAILYGHGGGSTPAFWLQQAQKRKRLGYIGSGAQRWSAVHVDDLAQLVVLALESAQPSGVYNAVTHDYSLREAAEGLAEVLGEGFSAQSMFAGSAAAQWGVFWATLLRANLWMSGEKAAGDFGWQEQAPRFLDEIRSHTGNM